MQVHKETIDKIPNALPNRNSVEIEIYGMEGIPQGDVREHETKKNDKPSSATINISSSTINKNSLQSSVTTPNLMPPPHLIRPPPGLPPPFMMPPMPGMPFPPIPTNLANLPPLPRPPIDLNINNPPPLFPAAINNLTSSTTLNNNDLNKITKSAGDLVNNKQMVTTNGTNSTTTTTAAVSNLIIQPANGKIIHPEEDISLEEHRGRQAKYSKIKSISSITNVVPNVILQNYMNHHLPPSVNLQGLPLLSNSINNNNSMINNYSRSFSNDNNDSSQPCYSTPTALNDHSRNYYRKA